MKSLNEGMQKINETFTEALQAGDAKILSQVYAEDALLMVENFSGKLPIDRIGGVLGEVRASGDFKPIWQVVIQGKDCPE